MLTKRLQDGVPQRALSQLQRTMLAAKARQAQSIEQRAAAEVRVCAPFASQLAGSNGRMCGVLAISYETCALFLMFQYQLFPFGVSAHVCMQATQGHVGRGGSNWQLNLREMQDCNQARHMIKH